MAVTTRRPSVALVTLEFAARLAAVAALTVSVIAASPAPANAGGAAVGAQPPFAARPVPTAASALPALPDAWPSSNLEIGLADAPNGAAALHQSGAYKFRYQYLCGGVNTGTGWSTWNANAKFADYYVDESVAHGITPVFIYYQLLQSKPAGGAEDQADLNNLKNTSTMKSYWADVRLLFQHLGAYSQTIVIDVEPDLWGYIQQAATADNAASVPAAVASSGDSDVAGLPNNAAGFAQAFIRMRDKYAPNVLLGYHMSIWGTMWDIIYSNSSDAQVDQLAARSATFEGSLHAGFDISFGDPSDRDAAFHEIVDGRTESWWSTRDYAAFDRYVGDFVAAAGLRMVLWQIPLGNTKMLAMNNKWGHYQDNHVEWWLDDSTATHLAATVNAGVVALLYGGGADGTTSAYDAEGDGVTNPAAIGANTRSSYSADDDGGYFRHQTNIYYAVGAMALPDASAPPVVTGTYHPIAPVRLLDTRSGNGLSGKLAGSAPRTFQVTGRGGITAGSTAVTANVTVVHPSAAASVYLGPEPLAYPATSTINFNYNDTTAYGSTIALKADGTMSATYMVSSGATDLVIDITGYFTPDNLGATYHSIAPARLLDTRTGNGLAGKFNAGVPRAFQVWGRGGVPGNATAVTGNVTVTGATSTAAVYVGPDPIVSPLASTINFAAGQVRANSLTVAIGQTGALNATLLASGTNTTDLVFDVTGYYTADATGAGYVPIAPDPLLDTGTGNGLSGKFTAGSPRTVAIGGRGRVPLTATGVAGIVSVRNQTANYALFIGPSPVAKPPVSNLNFVKGDNCSNGFTVALSAAGMLSVTYLGPAKATTNVALVITGYFTPLTP